MVVVDFTNNAKAILRAFVKYRKGTPFEPEEPDKEQCVKLYTNLKCEEKQKVKGQRADSVVAGGEAVLGKAVNDTVQTFMPANAHHAVAQRHSRPKAPHLDDGLAFPRIEIFERLQAAIEGYEIMAPLGLKGHHLFN